MWGYVYYVLNILMEANCGELNITAPMYKIAKPPHKALLDTDAVYIAARSAVRSHVIVVSLYTT